MTKDQEERMIEALIACTNLLCDYGHKDCEEGEAWRAAVAIIYEVTDGARCTDGLRAVLEAEQGKGGL